MPLEADLLVTSVDKLIFNNIANDAGEWYINENLDLVCPSVLDSDSILSDTSTDIDSDSFVCNRYLDIIVCTSKVIIHGA